MDSLYQLSLLLLIFTAFILGFKITLLLRKKKINALLAATGGPSPSVIFLFGVMCLISFSTLFYVSFSVMENVDSLSTLAMYMLSAPIVFIIYCALFPGYISIIKTNNYIKKIIHNIIVFSLIFYSVFFLYNVIADSSEQDPYKLDGVEISFNDIPNRVFKIEYKSHFGSGLGWTAENGSYEIGDAQYTVVVQMWNSVKLNNDDAGVWYVVPVNVSEQGKTSPLELVGKQSTYIGLFSIQNNESKFQSFVRLEPESDLYAILVNSIHAENNEIFVQWSEGGINGERKNKETILQYSGNELHVIEH